MSPSILVSHDNILGACSIKIREFLAIFGLRRSIKFFPHRFLELTIYHPSSGLRDYFYAVWDTPKPRSTRAVQSEVDFYSQFICPGDVVIDVGAHIGDSTLAYAVCAGIDGHVYGLEPNPATFQILASFCIANTGRVSITPVPWALGLADASTNFQYGDHWLDNGGYHEEWVFSHGSTYEIPAKVVTLETFLGVINLNLKDVAFLKLDCEGVDLAVVETIVASVRNEIPVIQFEVLYGLSDLELRLKALASKFHLFGVVSDPFKGLRLVDLDFGVLRSKGQIDVMLVPNEVYRNILSRC